MRRQGLMMLWLAIGAATVWAVPASATVVTAQADGTVTLTAETSADSGGSGISSIIVRHGGTQQTPDEAHIVFSVGGPIGTPFDTVEPLELAPSSASWCTAQVFGAFVQSITCETDEVDHISATLGDGDDFLLAQALSRIGGHRPGDPAGAPAVIADLGAGDDTFVGSALAETVYDGPGTDNVQGYAPGGGGHDRLVQPDVANPAVEDAGDQLDTDYVAGVVDYGARTSGGVKVTARDWVQNDGAPGENDRVTAYGVRGTEFADEITAAITSEEFIAFDFAGGGGDDVIRAGAGADKIDGGAGDDEITGDIGADEISGGPGDDEIDENDGNPEGSIACGAGADTVKADPADVDDDIEPAGDAGAGCETVTRAALPPLETMVTAWPGPATSDNTPTVEFESSEPRAWFECSLNGGDWTPCGSPLTPPSPLADGSHELRVRSVWGVRTDPTPAQFTTLIDTGDPETTVLPPDLPEDGVLAKTWSSDEDGSWFRCSIDGGPWVDCTLSLAVAEVAVGEHELAVQAVDAADNADPTPATTTFRVPAKPTVSITGGPGTGHRNEDLTFTATAGPASDGGPAPELAWDVDGDGFDDGSASTVTTSYADLGAKTVRVRATDAGGGRATAARTVTIVNRAASCTAVSRRTEVGASVSVPLTCVDADGDPLSLSKASDPAHGTLGAIVSGAVTYTPAAGYFGADSFTYRADDGTTSSAPATVSLVVTRVPVCAPASAETPSGSAVTVALSCTDADGDAVTLEVVVGPRHGKLGAIAGGTVTYTPAAGYSGADAFTFRAGDGTATSAPATISLTVKPRLTDPVTGTAGGDTTDAGAPSGGSTPPPPADTKPPAATVTAVRRQALAKVLGKGLAIAVKLDEAGTVKVTLTVDARTARRLRLAPKAKKPVVIGALTRPLGAGGGTMTVKLTAKARKALKKAKSVKVGVALAVTDAAGNTGTKKGSATLKR